MLVNKEKLTEYIPQRAPMIMVDNLLSSNEETLSARSSFYIEETNIFCEDGVFKEPGLVENIAQSCALRAGYTFHSKNEKVPLGFIGAVKNLQIHFFPKAGTLLETEIQVVNEIFDVTLVVGKVYSEGKIAAECEMKIFLKKEA